MSKYATESGKVIYYPRFLERHAERIVAAFEQGATTAGLAVKYQTSSRHIVAVLKARGKYKYRQSGVLPVNPPKLIKHPSERFAYSLHIEEEPVPDDVHRNCLRCRKPFVTHPAIYICEPCSKSADFGISGEYAMAVG
jgi:hypothetical protein